MLPPLPYTPYQATGTWDVSPPCPRQGRANPKRMENRDAFIEYLLCARHQNSFLIAIIVFNPFNHLAEFLPLSRAVLKEVR